MIKLENLCKVYKTKKTEKTALNNISFTLPSNGIVFVVGKSGSGKTTLMNLIGGLDYVSSGKITVDGNEISNFTEEEYENYRNSYVGFIFQDFFLLNDFTVKENISLALEMQSKECSDEEIIKILKLVDLGGLENRYPNELSGGQKQRVSIARALIKNPKLILADEPTGNLDSVTAQQILDVLRELSKDRLILIVSHNMNEAQKYADRIIKIDEGKVIKDIKRINSFEKTLITNDNIINFPYNVKLSDNELEKINECAKTGKFTLSQDMSTFEETKEVVLDDNKNEIKKYKVKKKTLIMLNNKFQKRNIKQSIMSSIAVSLMIVLLMISLVFVEYKSGPIIQKTMEYTDDTSFVLRKGKLSDAVLTSLQENTCIEIVDEEIQSFYNKGYAGNIYKFYNKSIPTSIGKYYSTRPDSAAYEKKETAIYSNYGLGVLECDVDYLIHLFGESGKLNLIAGSLDSNFKPEGYLIPDYLADSIIYNTPTLHLVSKDVAYKLIVELETINGGYTVKGIFDTNYEEKYSNVFNVFKENISSPSDEVTEKYQKMFETEEYIQFLNECDSYLNIAYYIGEKPLIESILSNTNTLQKYVQKGNCLAKPLEEEYNSNTITGPVVNVSNRLDIKEGELYIHFTEYNKLFGKTLKSNDFSGFEEKEIVLCRYERSDSKFQKRPIYEKTFKIVGVFNYEFEIVSLGMCQEDYEYFLGQSVFVCALYFDNTESITNVFSPNKNEFSLYFSSNSYYNALYKFVSAFAIFEVLFSIFVVVLTLGSIIIMCSQIRRNVKRKTYEIGVLKGIGLKNKYVFEMFFSQMLTLILAIFTFSTISIIFTDSIINDMLINNIEISFPGNLKEELVFFSYRSIDILIIYSLIIMIGLLTTIILISSLKKIKPINIIKAAND